MSGDSYSAQLNVRKSVGEPQSRIMHLSSLFLLNQYCFVPRTDWSIVHKFASRCSSLACILLNNVQQSCAGFCGTVSTDYIHQQITLAFLFATVSKTRTEDLF